MNKELQKKVIIRLVKPSDMVGIYHLSNENEIREISFNPNKISPSTHKIWFNRIINDSSKVFIVALLNEKIIGQIRLSIEGDNGVLSISVSHDYQGFGIGRQLLSFLIKYAKEKFPHVNKMTALVKEKNGQSISFFQKAMFLRIDKIRLNNANVFHYQLSL